MSKDLLGLADNNFSNLFSHLFPPAVVIFSFLYLLLLKSLERSLLSTAVPIPMSPVNVSMITSGQIQYLITHMNKQRAL